MQETKEIETPNKPCSRPKDTTVQQVYRWKRTFWQLLRFGLVGGINTAIDLFTLNILLWCFPTNNIEVLVGYNSIAYTCGAASSFFLNKYWTFGHKRRTSWKEVKRFIISLFCEVLYSNVLIWLAGKILQPFIANPVVWANVSKLFAVGVGAIITYSIMRFWIFAGGSQELARRQEADPSS